MPKLGVQIGQVVFPVLVGYGTGDTFGRSEGNVEIVAVFSDPEKATRLRDAIIADESVRNGSQFDFEGQTVYTYSWKGYFESFEWCRVETELVRA